MLITKFYLSKLVATGLLVSHYSPVATYRERLVILDPNEILNVLK